jgi:hypothetical protein
MSPARSDETFLDSEETILGRRRSDPETIAGQPVELIKRRSSIMWTVLSVIYRRYCLARLMEMRRSHLYTVP